MIGRLYRFHGYGSLRGLYRRGKSVRSPSLALKYDFRNPNRPYRMAVVVSRKVSKSAVVRNRIRRRIYEIVRTQPEAKLAGYDLVFTAFSDELASLEPAQLERTVLGLLRKATTAPKPDSPPQAPQRAIVKPKETK